MNHTAKPMKSVTPDAIRSELAKILASPEFARAERLSSLLLCGKSISIVKSTSALVDQHGNGTAPTHDGQVGLAVAIEVARVVAQEVMPLSGKRLFGPRVAVVQRKFILNRTFSIPVVLRPW